MKSGVKFIVEPKSVSVQFGYLGINSYKVGLSILFNHLQPNYDEKIRFHYVLKYGLGCLQVFRNDRNLRGKYIVDYDTLIGMVKSCLPELYMPMFLKLLYNFNQQQNVRNKKIIDILDNDNIPIENKQIMLRELDRISNFNDKKVIKRYKNSYEENEKNMIECEELLIKLN